MARTNIEEEAHRRVAKLAQLMKCSDREALGTVGYLWTDSQDILATHGSREQILEWAHLFNLSEEVCNNWISSLEKSRFISCLDSGQFKIHGNETQIESRVKHSTRAAKGGKALQKKWNEKKKLKAGLKKATSLPQAPLKPATSPSMQGNAIQCKAEQGNAIQCIPEEHAASKKPTKAGAFIAGYKSRFLSRWEATANIEGKDAGIAKRVAERLSFEDIDTYLDAFFLMPDTELIQKKHPVFLFEVKLNAITVYAQNGKFTSRREAIQADDSLALHAQIQRIRGEAK